MGDLELNILSCLLIKPELMGEVILEDKHFKKHYRLWKFMKTFYSKFKTFDIQLMYSVCQDKWHIVNYIEMLIMQEPDIKNFEKYQRRLIEEQEYTKKEKWIVAEIYDLANELIVGKVKTKDFRNKINEIYENAEKIFEGE